MLSDFVDFLKRGNVIDLAVAVIIGAAFGAIVTSMTDDIIMPVIGALMGGVDFTTLVIQVGAAQIAYGNFIQAIINFIIIAFVIFLMVRAYNNMTEDEEPAAPAGPSEEALLLTEIRDLLKQQN